MYIRVVFLLTALRVVRKNSAFDIKHKVNYVMIKCKKKRKKRKFKRISRCIQLSYRGYSDEFTQVTLKMLVLEMTWMKKYFNISQVLITKERLFSPHHL